MGGGDGTVIIRDTVKKVLTHPTVHGRLPIAIQTGVDPVLAKDPADWDAQDRLIIANAVNWALCNL